TRESNAWCTEDALHPVPAGVTCRTEAGAVPARDVATVLPCRVADPDLWFAENPAQLEQAKALCAACPIRQGCLSAAIDRREPWGVWGGEIFGQGGVIAP